MLHFFKCLFEFLKHPEKATYRSGYKLQKKVYATSKNCCGRYNLKISRKDISCPVMHYTAKVFQAADFPRHIFSEASTDLSFIHGFISVNIFWAQKIASYELRKESRKDKQVTWRLDFKIDFYQRFKWKLMLFSIDYQIQGLEDLLVLMQV